MSRGGRRRRGRNSGLKTASPRAAGGQNPAGVQTQPRPRRRRGGHGRGAREESVLESMSSRPRQLQTLPPDGLVLDELISDLKSEYGVPATPQAYRLIIRLPAEDQPDSESSEADQSEVRTEGPEAPAGPRVPEASEGPRVPGAPARRRRRRRGRRGRSQQGHGEVATAGDAPGAQAPATNEDSAGASQ